MTREIKTGLSDSRVGYNSVVDHRSRRPVLSPLRSCVNRCHVCVWPYCRTSRCKPWRWMLKDISMHRPIWVIFDGAKYLISCRCATQRRRSNIAEHWQPWKLESIPAMEVISHVFISMKIWLMRALVWPVATYGCESWTLTKNEETRLDTFEMKGLRKIMRVSWTAKKTNESGFLTKLE